MPRLCVRTTGKLTRNGDSRVIVIPRAMCHTLGWDYGTDVVLTIVGKAIVLQSVDDEVLHRRRLAVNQELDARLAEEART